jgi:hypothetical protein
MTTATASSAELQAAITGAQRDLAGLERVTEDNRITAARAATGQPFEKPSMTTLQVLTAREDLVQRVLGLKSQLAEAEAADRAKRKAEVEREIAAVKAEAREKEPILLKARQTLATLEAEALDRGYKLARLSTQLRELIVTEADRRPRGLTSQVSGMGPLMRG